MDFQEKSDQLKQLLDVAIQLNSRLTKSHQLMLASHVAGLTPGAKGLTPPPESARRSVCNLISTIKSLTAEVRPSEDMQWLEVDPFMEDFRNRSIHTKLTLLRAQLIGHGNHQGTSGAPAPTPTTPANETSKSPVNARRKRDAYSKLNLGEKAVALKVAHPDWTAVQIADHLGATRQALYKYPAFTKIMGAMRADKKLVAKGSKNRNGTIEAWDDND